MIDDDATVLHRCKSIANDPIFLRFDWLLISIRFETPAITMHRCKLITYQSAEDGNIATATSAKSHPSSTHCLLIESLPHEAMRRMWQPSQG